MSIKFQSMAQYIKTLPIRTRLGIKRSRNERIPCRALGSQPNPNKSSRFHSWRTDGAWFESQLLHMPPNAGLQPQTREAGLSDWKPLLGGALEDAMNAQDFAALARQVTKDLSGKTLDHATFAECGMGYSLTLHFTDGTSSTITPEHDEGFRFTTPNASVEPRAGRSE